MLSTLFFVFIFYSIFYFFVDIFLMRSKGNFAAFVTVANIMPTISSNEEIEQHRWE